LGILWFLAGALAPLIVTLFDPPHWYHLDLLNNRTHRKILVIDGRIGFTGGVGIAPQWEGDAEDPDHWRDTHFKVGGPVVAQLQSVFNDEVNLNVYDDAYAGEQPRLFDADLARSRRVTFAEWKGRPRRERIEEKLAGLIRSQL
jgi:phosphatidylserine/phosphatidylglycerophosphate/cardiolipin synthase-like enzyme